jgi:hypothetical protein|tara:strand:- start:1209 stop:1721 length:513 start_codon:yes stop_codon:yes gene_type:complete
MLKRFIWMAVLIVAMVVGTYGIGTTFGYADPIHIIAIAALTVLAMVIATKIVGLTLISQKWVDEVEIVEEEEDLGEAAEWTTSDELKDIRELVEWKSNQMSELQHYTTERLDELEQKIDEISDLQDDRFQDLQDNIDVLTGKLLQKDAKWQDLYGSYDEDGLPVIQATPK